MRPADAQVVLPDPPPGFSSAALPFASIAYPDGWYVLDTSPLVPYGIEQPSGVLTGPVVQLANFDPDLPHSPRCMVDPDALPDGGVLLTIGIMTPAEAEFANPPSGPWPVELEPLPSNQDPVCVGGPRPRIAVWTAPNGLIYWANAAEDPERGPGRCPEDGAGVREPRISRDGRAADVADGRVPEPGHTARNPRIGAHRVRSRRDRRLCRTE